MDDALCVGGRVITRAFEQDRHSRAVLAEAFEQLTVASVRFEPFWDGVQIRRTRGQAEPQLQEANA